MRNAWVVRPYPHNIYRMREFLEGNLVAVGWPALGDLTGMTTRDEIKHQLSKQYGGSARPLGAAAGSLYRFVVEILKGDFIVVPDGDNVYFSVVTSDYRYEPTVATDEEGYPHQRKVRWLQDGRPLPRKALTGRMSNTLKGRLSVFSIYNVGDVETTVDRSDLFKPGADTDLKPRYLHKLQDGSLRGVNPFTFEEAVRKLLSLYYPSLDRQSTRNSSSGDTDLKADLPGDVVVRIQVKNFYPSMGHLGEDAVRQLADSMEPGDIGIVVTSGVVGNDAKDLASKYAEKGLYISFIDGQQFVDLLFENIDSIDEQSLGVFGLTRKPKIV